VVKMGKGRDARVEALKLLLGLRLGTYQNAWLYCLTSSLPSPCSRCAPASSPAAAASSPACFTMFTYEKAEVSGGDGFGPCPDPACTGGGHQSPCGVRMRPSPAAAWVATL
jgi:hypothetical protein